jgi:hypothetical protein
MPFLWPIVSKAIFAAGALVAVFVVAWYFYIHSHAARTEGSVAISLAREVRGEGDARCRDQGRGWRCTIGKRSFVVVRGKENCWRVRGRDLEGCVKVLDYVRGVF